MSRIRRYGPSAAISAHSVPFPDPLIDRGGLAEGEQDVAGKDPRGPGGRKEILAVGAADPDHHHPPSPAGRPPIRSSPTSELPSVTWTSASCSSAPRAPVMSRKSWTVGLTMKVAAHFGQLSTVAGFRHPRLKTGGPDLGHR